jgi:hypothetical protein
MFITTEDNLARDAWNDDGTLDSMTSYFSCELASGVKFVEDDADLTGITYETVTSTPQLEAELSDVCKKILADTDWYVVRKTEADVEIPTHISSLRATLRALI